MKKLRVGVIYGGRSGEHEVSLASAAAVFQNLDSGRYEAVPIRIEKDGRWALPNRAPHLMKAADVIARESTEAHRHRETEARKHERTEGRRQREGDHETAEGRRQEREPRGRLDVAAREALLVAHPGGDTLLTIDRDDSGATVSGFGLDVVFPVLHGPYGEDGTVQGLLELANVPYVGAGVLASAVGMDKAVMKLVFAAKGLPICDYEVVLKPDWQRDERGVMHAVVAKLGFPVFVKPANLGSSVGISKAKHAAELRKAISVASEFDRKIVIEAAVPDAREIECAVLGNDEPEASVPGEIIPSREFYDYEAKYLDEGSRSIIPAELTAAQSEEIRTLAVAAFKAIDCAGMARA